MSPEAAATRRYKELAHMLRDLPEIVVVADRAGTIVWCNRTARSKLGYSLKSLCGRPLECLHPEEARSEVGQAFTAMLEGGSSSFSQPLLCHDGRRIAVEIRVAPCLWQGRSALAALMRDRSLQLTLEQHIRQQAEDFQAMAESSRDGVLVIDASKTPVYANGSTTGLTGLDPAALLAVPVTDWLCNNGGTLVEHCLARARDKAAPAHQEVVIHRRDGSVLPVEMSISRTLWKQAEAWMLELRDISWRRRLQEQVVSAATWEKERIAHLLHDSLAQQVAAARYLARAVKQDLAAAGRREAPRLQELETLLQDCQQQLRSLSRGLFPNLETNRLNARVQHLLTATEALFAVKCRLRQGQLLQPVAGSRAVNVYYMVQEAIMNAVRHGKPRRIEVTLKLLEDEWIRMDVSDDGSGFDVDAADMEAHGLHIMRYRADCLGARWALTSQPGRGTRVRFELPLRAPALATTSAAAAEAPQEQPA